MLRQFVLPDRSCGFIEYLGIAQNVQILSIIRWIGMLKVIIDDGIKKRGMIITSIDLIIVF